MKQFLGQLGQILAMQARGLWKANADDHDVVATAENTSFDPLKHQVEPRIRAVAKDGARQALDQVDADVERLLGQANAKAVAWAEERAGELIDSVSETTRGRVREVVAQALAEGWSNGELADALGEDDAFSDARAERIARTETAAADIAGNLIGWKESGLVTGKQWLVAQDSACDLCEDLDEEIVGIDEEFPGDGGDGPPLHPGCRCDCLPVLADEDEE